MFDRITHSTVVTRCLRSRTVSSLFWICSTRLSCSYTLESISESFSSFVRLSLFGGSSIKPISSLLSHPVLILWRLPRTTVKPSSDSELKASWSSPFLSGTGSRITAKKVIIRSYVLLWTPESATRTCPGPYPFSPQSKISHIVHETAENY